MKNETMEKEQLGEELSKLLEITLGLENEVLSLGEYN